MKKRYVLWGTKVNEPDYMEEVLLESTSPINLDEAIAWGNDNGYKNMRILETFDGDKPNFN